MAKGERIRRGVTFGGVALLLSLLIVPLALNAVWQGPVPEALTAMLWLVILALTAFGFYLGYSGWGRDREF